MQVDIRHGVSGMNGWPAFLNKLVFVSRATLDFQLHLLESQVSGGVAHEQGSLRDFTMCQADPEGFRISLQHAAALAPNAPTTMLLSRLVNQQCISGWARPRILVCVDWNSD